MGQQFTLTPFVWLWKSYCLSKQKLLFWLLLNDRLNTGIFFGAKFLILRVLSVLCSGHERESLKHMFFVCPFCQRCWRGIGINWDLDLSVIDLIQAGKVTSLLSCFREIVIIMCWKIWKLRNNLIFNKGVVWLSVWKSV